MINWSRCIWRTFVFYSTEGYLIDYLLTECGIIFYSQTAVKIPVSGFVQYTNLLTLHPILSLEHNISSCHLKDVEIYNKIKEMIREEE